MELDPARIPLIKSIHKWTRMLFIILNSKLGIRLCSQSRIDLISQSNFYDVLTSPYKYLSNTLSSLYTGTTCTQYNLHVSFIRLWEFHAITKQFPFPIHPSLTRSHCHNNTWPNFRTSKISGQELPYGAACLSRITKICLDLLEINHWNIKNVDDLHEFHLSLNKPTSKMTVASYDLAPDTSSGINYGGVIAQGFCGSSNHQWNQIMLRNFKLQIQP